MARRRTLRRSPRGWILQVSEPSHTSHVDRLKDVLNSPSTADSSVATSASGATDTDETTTAVATGRFRLQRPHRPAGDESNESPGRAGGFTVAGPSKGPYRDGKERTRGGLRCAVPVCAGVDILSGPPAHVNPGQYLEEPTAENVKLLLPPRQSRGTSPRVRPPLSRFLEGRCGQYSIRPKAVDLVSGW